MDHASAKARPDNESEQVLSVQHGINCHREESQISEPGDATIREKAPNPFHLIRREAVSFLLPTSRPLFQARRLGARFLAMAFRSNVWFLPIAQDIEADPNVGFTIACIIWLRCNPRDRVPPRRPRASAGGLIAADPSD